MDCSYMLQVRVSKLINISSLKIQLETQIVLLCSLALLWKFCAVFTTFSEIIKNKVSGCFFCPVGQPKNVFFSRILYSNICGIKFYSTSVTEYIPYCPILNECFYILLQSITLTTRHKLQCVFF